MRYNLDWIKNKFDNGDAIKYIFFWGHTNKNNEEVGKYVFSQWFYSPFTVDNVEYKTSEHWMMANKAKIFGDLETFYKIIMTEKPGEVKDLGRRIKNFEESKWDEVKYDVVRNGNLHKFNQNRKLKDYLLSTGGRVIVEASPTDAIWGIGLSQDAMNVSNPHTWKGLNLLGFAIMETRDILNL